MATLPHLHTTNNDNLLLSTEEQQLFAEALIKPPTPNEKLRKAVNIYFKEVVTSDPLTVKGQNAAG